MTSRTLALSLAMALLAGAALASAADRIVAPVNLVYTDDRNNPVASTWTDPDTGCDYLIRGDTMVTRLKRDGLPLCHDL